MACNVSDYCIHGLTPEPWMMLAEICWCGRCGQTEHQCTQSRVQFLCWRNNHTYVTHWFSNLELVSSKIRVVASLIIRGRQPVAMDTMSVFPAHCFRSIGFFCGSGKVPQCKVRVENTSRKYGNLIIMLYSL